MLCDSHRRAIYDTMGSKGLWTDDWEVVQRTKTPREIREKHERLVQVKRRVTYLTQCSLEKPKFYLVIQSFLKVFAWLHGYRFPPLFK